MDAVPTATKAAIADASKNIDQRIDQIDMRVKGVKLVCKFIVVICAAIAYFILKSSDDKGVWVREGNDAVTNATCFIFASDQFKKSLVDVNVEVVSVKFTALNITLVGSELEKHCGYMSNYTVSQKARLSVLLEESDIASNLSLVTFAVAMILVLQALHFARNAVATECGARKKPTPDVHHEGQQNGKEGKTGCCNKLGQKLSWLYHKSESFFTNVCHNSSIHSDEAFELNWSKRWCGVP